MLRILAIIAVFLNVVSCDEPKSGGATTSSKGASERDEIDYSKVFPENPDGEFYRSLREPPDRKVVIDLGSPSDISGLPTGVQWFPMGDKEFCAIQGTTDLHLTLPSGQIIHEEFAIVYVDKDDEGIFRIRADSLGWLRVPVALQRLDREVEFFTKEGTDAASLRTRATEIRYWMENFDHNSNMYEGIGYRSDGVRLSFSLFVTMTTKIGIRYCYRAELPRSKARRRANWDTRKNKAEQDGADQPATAPELKLEGDLKPQPESKGRPQ